MRGITFLPQIAARAGESVFGAKMPRPAFFMAAARFLPASFFSALGRLDFFAAFFTVFFTAFFTALRKAG